MKRLVLFLLFLIIILSGCKVEQTTSDESHFDLQAEIAKCQNQTYSYGADVCYDNLAEKTKDISLCAKVADTLLSSTCFYQVTTALNTSEGCAHVKTDLRDTCYANFLICDEVKGQQEKQRCLIGLARESQNIQTCEQLTSKFQEDDCYSDLAVSRKNISLCNKISDQYRKDDCTSGVAFVLDDLEICREIETDRIRDSCYEHIAVKKNDEKLCQLGNSTKERCYASIAKAKNDIEICTMIANKYQYLIMTCYEQIAVIRNDMNICEKIGNVSFRDDCYSGFAFTFNQTNVCEEISGSSKKSECYSTLALRINNSNLCAQISNISDRDDCFYSFINRMKSLDKNICNQIQDKLNRMYCLARITDMTILYKLKRQSPTLCSQYKFNFSYYNVTKKVVREKDIWSTDHWQTVNATVCEVKVYISNYESFNLPVEVVMYVYNTGLVIPVFQQNDTQGLAMSGTITAQAKTTIGTFSYGCSGNQTAIFQVYPLVDPVRCLVD